MQRVKAVSSNVHILASAFSGARGERTIILLNRSAAGQYVTVHWSGAEFRYRETADAQHENSVEPAPGVAGGSVEVQVPPGAIITLTNVELGRAGERG